MALCSLSHGGNSNFMLNATYYSKFSYIPSARLNPIVGSHIPTYIMGVGLVGIGLIGLVKQHTKKTQWQQEIMS